jgi:hypothetical protein
MKVECPRCGKIHEVAQGIDEVDCNCHLVCPSGSKPGDCSVSVADLHGQVGWPYGLHNNPVDESDDPMHVTYYCATHSKYYYKTPIIIPVDWTLTKLPKKFRR